MNVVILETGHFQYTLTLSAVFHDCNILIITTSTIRHEIESYSSGRFNLLFKEIKSIEEDAAAIENWIKAHNTNLLHISPVFDSYSALAKLLKGLNCTKVLTTHNINTWFNGRFWSPRSLMDRINMRKIIRRSDYIAVEDFIYHHLSSTPHPYFLKYSFVYIPFTIFHPGEVRIYQRKDQRIKIVLTGWINGDRRRYEDVLEVIKHFKERSKELCFSFAGRAKGEYGFGIREQLRTIKNELPDYVYFFEDDSTADQFRYEMETSDVVLSTSTETFKGMGTLEFIGKTKPTAAIHDMMTFELPGFLPRHLRVPERLEGSVFNYSGVDDLIGKIEVLLDQPQELKRWKEKAKENSLNFTPDKIRKQLPF